MIIDTSRKTINNRRKSTTTKQSATNPLTNSAKPSAMTPFQRDREIARLMGVHTIGEATWKARKSLKVKPGSGVRP
jgi:hypothetical protein